MIDPERYCLGLLAGEMGEAIDVIGNALRFGLHTPERGDGSAANHLEAELGDVLAAIHFAGLHRLVDFETVKARRDRKLDKLLDPARRDNLGRRLAPAPPQPLSVSATGGERDA